MYYPKRAKLGRVKSAEYCINDFSGGVDFSQDKRAHLKIV